MKLVGWVVALGALNWGLVGLLNLDLVATLLGEGSLLTRVVYVVVGAAGAYKLYMLVSKKK